MVMIFCCCVVCFTVLLCTVSVYTQGLRFTVTHFPHFLSRYSKVSASHWWPTSRASRPHLSTCSSSSAARSLLFLTRGTTDCLAEERWREAVSLEDTMSSISSMRESQAEGMTYDLENNPTSSLLRLCADIQLLLSSHTKSLFISCLFIQQPKTFPN